MEPSQQQAFELDFEYEANILRDPYSLKNWWRYIDAKRKTGTPKVRNLIYERALKEIPGSYKIWFSYLEDRMLQVKNRCINDPAYEAVNNTFERALIYMHKMPRIWEEYCNFLITQKKLTRTRRTLDRALCALPITQHDRIWKIYIKFIQQPYVPPETAVRVYRRYLKLYPQNAEDYVDYLISVNYFDEAATQLAKLVNDDDFVSAKGRTKHDMWMDLCDIITKHPKEIKSIRVEPIIRSGLSKFSSEVGQLWCALADYYIRDHHFEKARDIFEEGMATVATVRDFSAIFDAYAQFEESLVTAKMEEKDAMEQGDEEEEEEQDFTLDDELEMRIARLENLLDRRPLLLSDVMLRQNPHNVHEWHKRVKIFKKTQPIKAIEVFKTAVETIDPNKAVGRLNVLWVDFARFYERHGDLSSARVVFEKAIGVNFRSVDQLAHVWCEYAEFEMRQQNYSGALKLMQRATAAPPRKQRKLYEEEPVQAKVHKSVKLWSLYADLEESLGTIESTKAVYDRCIDLKVITPQMIINYATLLEENKFFEDSFKAYERGIALFTYPQVFDIWVIYLTKFIERYGGRKLERARDLFEQATKGAPAEFAKPLFLMYAKLEEDYGLARHAMDVYERATKAVKDDERYEIYNIYINRAAEFFGVTRTREIYERAIEALPDKYVKDMCIKYADLERKLGEIDRARAIYVHASQFCDPRVTPTFWKIWYEFEVAHGNEDTFREMLRIKRSVQATYSTSVNFMAASMLENQQKIEAEAAAAKAQKQAQQMSGMERLEREVTSAAQREKEANPEEISLDLEDIGKQGANPEEIELPDQRGEEEAEELGIEEVSVPQGVFGAAGGAAATGKRAAEAPATSEEKAIDRLKKKRRTAQ